MKINAESMSRRSFLGTLAAASATPLVGFNVRNAEALEIVAAQVGEVLRPWTPGTLEIHHISTGRGNCAFILCPDGTTILIDAGAQYPASDALHGEKYLISPKPDASKRPGEWIARYIKRRLTQCENKEIDFFVLTHLHSDHMGGLPPKAADTHKSALGDYVLTGVMDVHEQVRIRCVLDRGFPHYDYPVPATDSNQLNYRAFLAAFTRRGGKVEMFRSGSASQIRLQKTPATAGFSIQNLAANGKVWGGSGESARSTFPKLASLHPADYPDENMCSAALRLSFGLFRYYSGGDLVHETHYGRLPWADIETAVARAAGPVCVALANHHGYVNGCGPEFVRELRPSVFVISAWDSAHPTIPSLDNMLSRELYPASRGIFATAVKPENVIATKRLAELQSYNGHIVIRVPEDGKTFEVIVTSNADESDTITSRFGPCLCQ